MEFFRLKIELFFRRFCAYIIDISILIVLVYLIDSVVKNMFMNFENNYIIRIVLYNIISLLYFSIQEATSWQATIGKRLLGIFVCDIYGDKISFKRSLIRNIARYINFFIFSLGYIFIFFTKRQQGLHDMLSKTIVVIEEN